MTDWIQEHAAAGTTPEGAVRLWLQAALTWGTDPTDAAAGLQRLTIPLMKDDAWHKRPSNGTFVERLRDQPHIFRSYAEGALPDNAYAAPDGWRLNVHEVKEPRDDRGTAVFITSGGADNPRPLYLKQSSKTGLWFVNAFANAYLGVRPMVDPEAETFF